MRRSSRRIFLYWLLLLVPTLVVGGGAMLLLWREQARLNEQAKTAEAARIEAIQARVRLIAENVETLVGDVQSALMDTLRSVPVLNDADAFLDQWEKNNPLVRSTFHLIPQEPRAPRVLRPAAGTRDVQRAWVVAWATANSPWKGGEPKAAKESEADQERRGDIAANTANALNARNELQQAARQSQMYAPAAKDEAVSADLRESVGWSPWRDASELHLFGWRYSPAIGVWGVEVELSAIVARLGDTLPKEGNLAASFELRDALGQGVFKKKSYALRDADNSGLEQVGKTVVVPISAALLPGWEVVGVALASPAGPGAGGGFLLVGSLLVAIFVAAILSGGSLLLMQARRSEAEAEQRTSFVANVSHEFKTPLTTIRLYAELLEQGRVRDSTQGTDYLKTIGRETQRLARLVNNALDFSRLEQGRKKYARDSLDLTAELTRLLDTHQPRVAEAGLTLKRNLPLVPLPAVGDRDALEQIVLNLLDNACKYAAEGGEVSVFLESKPSGGAEVRVADRGPGVPSEHRERIFEKFHRVDDALTAEKSGAGLGLSIARQLARGMGGGLSYRPRTDGGAEFIVDLP